MYLKSGGVNEYSLTDIRMDFSHCFGISVNRNPFVTLVLHITVTLVHAFNIGVRIYIGSRKVVVQVWAFLPLFS